MVYIERLRRLNGVPLSLDLTYLARDGTEPIVLAGATRPARSTGRERSGPAQRKPSGVARSPRILELLELAETEPTTELLTPYLTDPDPKVRRAAVATLTEVVPAGVAGSLAGALADGHGSVRHAAATALRELVEVLPATEEVRNALSPALANPDAVVRAAVLDVLRALRLGDLTVFSAAREDSDHRVRLQGVRGLVALDDIHGVGAAAHDPNREVRIAVAHGLGALGDPATAPTLGSWRLAPTSS